MLRPALLLLTGLALALGACRAPEGRAISEDLNANFLDPELDVGRMVDRFEGESREVYRERETIADAMHIEPGHVVADIGAGTGAFLAALSRRAGSEGRVIATDISSVFVAEMRKRAEREGLPNVRTQLVGERECGLRPDSVDRILICDVYHHFAYPNTTNRSLYEALRPGGELVLVDFHRIPGVSRPWLLSHVRAGMEVFQAELEAAGFVLIEEVPIEGLQENYVLRFRR
jgi:cyclopropane fatty-acyl-phospholipid synthase-like methyltransferase